jgi:hypothetical protein
MTPVKTKESTFTYLGPTHDIADMPCRREGRDTFSVWELSEEERLLIAGGANIRLGIHGMQPIPPVSLGVVSNSGCFAIVSCPCSVCGKEPTDPIHNNGPDNHAFKVRTGP